MTMDKSLRTRGGMAKTRSVLKRDERITRLADEGKFNFDGGNPFALAKIKVRHSKAGMKTKKVEEKAAIPAEGEAAAAPAEGAAPAAGKAPAAAAKAPAAAGKAAAKAPAAKGKGKE